MKKRKIMFASLLAGVLLISVPVWAAEEDTAKETDEVKVEAYLDEKDQDICYVEAQIPSLPSNTKKIRFKLEEREKDKKASKEVWFDSTKLKKEEDTWIVKLDDSDLESGVPYEVRVYAQLQDETKQELGMTAFQINETVVGAEEAKEEDAKEKETNAQVKKPEQVQIVDDATANAYGYYTIMGNTTVTAEQMADLYKSQGVSYPADALKSGGAPTIEDFCEIIMEEAEAEGVRAEVVYVQSMLETGWLQFRGDSQVEQFNFAGLGTTGGGVKGIYFPDVQTGIRAQVQHLKAYASDEDLNQECVDERFSLVTRESAPYIEWLGIQENPNGGGWAAGANYGDKLLNIMSQLKQIS